MTNKKVEALLTKIKSIRAALDQIGEMRPGSLTQQFHKRGGKRWPYWQISYTQKRSKTEYIRDEFVEQIRSEIVEYKKFKSMTEKWIELSIELSKERLKIRKKELEIEKSLRS